jgi:hypothetical protein
MSHICPVKVGTSQKKYYSYAAFTSENTPAILQERQAGKRWIVVLFRSTVANAHARLIDNSAILQVS